MSRVWSHSQQRGGELLVMLALADFANDAGESWPSVPTLAQKARLTERQTQRVLKNLEESGELRRTKSNGGRNRRSHYFVTITENPDIITVTKLHRKNNSEICDTETLTPMSPALNRHRTVRKRRSEAASPNPAVNQFKEFWATEYQKLFKIEYHFEHGKDGAAIKTMLGTFDLPTLKAQAEKFFTADDEWIQTKGGFTIGVFRSQINKLNSTSSKPQRNYEAGAFPNLV